MIAFLVDIHHASTGWLSTRYGRRMTTDRSADRHTKPGRIIRPDPPDLWQRLGDRVGNRRRSEIISALLVWYLDGGDPPERPWLHPRATRRPG